MTANTDIHRHHSLVMDPAEAVDLLTFDLAHRLDVAVWVFDIDTARILHANAPACHLWNAEDEDELRARNMGRDMSGTVTKRLKQYQTDFFDHDATFTELWTLYPNGEVRSVMVTFRGFLLADGRMAMQCQAVSDTQDLPENVRSAEALLHTDVMITLFSKQGPALYLNPAARNAIDGLTCDFGQLFADPDDHRALMAQIDIVGEHRCVTKLHTAQGARWFDVTVKDCSDAATGQPAILMTAIDVSELKEARDAARYLADRDQLTGIYNRTYLQNHFAKRDGQTNSRSAIVFFDVDKFKLINDRYGHDAGDTVLKAISQRTAQAFRSTDLVTRLGGDEFVVLVDGIDCQDELDRLISRLRSTISDPISHGKTRIDISISIGVSMFSPRRADFGDVLREADIALYVSKQEGRDRVTYFSDDMGAAVVARNRLEIEIKEGIERGEFVLHYQPRLNFCADKVVGVEALVRWEHPVHGLVAPNIFIPICEETGLIEDLGRQVLSDGCQQAIEWHQSGRDLDVSLNVSPRQFADTSFIQTLADLSGLPGFPHGRIELEITENVLIGDLDSIAEKLKAITTMGYKIAIDDFGTGYSNLAYISRFSLTCLKIDRSFIHQLPASGPIIQLILTLGQQIGATVVSEGIETWEQFEWLRQHNCCEAQGHFIAPALPVPELEAYLGQIEGA